MSVQTDLDTQPRVLAERYADFIVEELLPLGAEFCRADLPDADWVDQPFFLLKTHGCLRVVDRGCYDRPGNGYRNVYTVDDRVRRVAEDHVETRDALMPCGHRGLSNRGDGEFSCQYVGCGRVFSRAEVVSDD